MDLCGPSLNDWEVWNDLELRLELAFVAVCEAET